MSKKKIRSLNRESGKKEQYELIKIICEGEKTEPFYFEGLKKEERLSSINVSVNSDCGSDPLSIVNKGINEYELSIRKNEAYNIDIIFCVFDRDSHTNFNAALNRIKEFNECNNRLILFPIKSYPSFEFWYILHFYYTRDGFNKTQNKTSADLCERKLRNEWEKEFNCKYKKNLSNVYLKLIDKNKSGMANAEIALNDAISTNEFNPSTEAHLLVGFLLDIKTVGDSLKNILDEFDVFYKSIKDILINKVIADKEQIKYIINGVTKIKNEIQKSPIGNYNEVNLNRIKFCLKCIDENLIKLNEFSEITLVEE